MVPSYCADRIEFSTKLNVLVPLPPAHQHYYGVSGIRILSNGSDSTTERTAESVFPLPSRSYHPFDEVDHRISCMIQQSSAALLGSPSNNSSNISKSSYDSVTVQTT